MIALLAILAAGVVVAVLIGVFDTRATRASAAVMTPATLHPHPTRPVDPAGRHAAPQPRSHS